MIWLDGLITLLLRALADCESMLRIAVGKVINERSHIEPPAHAHEQKHDRRRRRMRTERRESRLFAQFVDAC